MEIWIKYLGEEKNNYTRFGRTIPKYEKKIDVDKYFSCHGEKARIKNIVDSLLSDDKIFCKVHKGA